MRHAELHPSEEIGAIGAIGVIGPIGVIGVDTIKRAVRQRICYAATRKTGRYPAAGKRSR
jgi:hypothetical protein